MLSTSLVDQGIAINNDLFSTEECDRIAARVDGIVRSSAGSRCLLDNAWCIDLAVELRVRLAQEVREVLDLVIVQCTYFHKTAQKNWLVAWHQDRSVPVAAYHETNELTGWSIKEGMLFVHGTDNMMSKMLAVRLHLDDSTLQNGPLRVVLGSHRFGTLAADEIAKLREESTETICAIPKGGVLLMRPLLLHASSKSCTTEPRRVLHFVFAPAEMPYGLAWKCAI